MGLQNVWGPTVAWEQFLAGAGAGAYLVAIIALWLGGRYQRLVKPGVVAGPILVAIGALLLLLDLGQPLRFWRAFLNPDSSMISVGVILITVFIVLGFIHILLALFTQGTERTQKWLGTIAAIIAVAVMAYPGLLLAQMNAVPFWNTPMLPLLYALSGLVTGIAVVVLLAALGQFLVPPVREEAEGEPMRVLGSTVAVLVVVELIALFFLLLVMNGAEVTAAASAGFLVTGGYALAFWLGVVLVGMVLPLVLEVWAVRRQQGTVGMPVGVSLLVAICLLVGGVVLRYAVLAAGAKFPFTG